MRFCFSSSKGRDRPVPLEPETEPLRAELEDSGLLALVDAERRRSNGVCRVTGSEETSVLTEEGEPESG